MQIRNRHRACETRQHDRSRAGRAKRACGCACPVAAPGATASLLTALLTAPRLTDAALQKALHKWLGFTQFRDSSLPADSSLASVCGRVAFGEFVSTHQTSLPPSPAAQPRKQVPCVCVNRTLACAWRVSVALAAESSNARGEAASPPSRENPRRRAALSPAPASGRRARETPACPRVCHVARGLRRPAGVPCRRAVCCTGRSLRCFILACAPAFSRFPLPAAAGNSVVSAAVTERFAPLRRCRSLMRFGGGE